MTSINMTHWLLLLIPGILGKAVLLVDSGLNNKITESAFVYETETKINYFLNEYPIDIRNAISSCHIVYLDISISSFDWNKSRFDLPKFPYNSRSHGLQLFFFLNNNSKDTLENAVAIISSLFCISMDTRYIFKMDMFPDKRVELERTLKAPIYSYSYIDQYINLHYETRKRWASLLPFKIRDQLDQYSAYSNQKKKETLGFLFGYSEKDTMFLKQYYGVLANRTLIDDILSNHFNNKNIHIDSLVSNGNTPNIQINKAVNRENSKGGFFIMEFFNSSENEKGIRYIEKTPFNVFIHTKTLEIRNSEKNLDTIKPKLFTDHKESENLILNFKIKPKETITIAFYFSKTLLIETETSNHIASQFLSYVSIDGIIMPFERTPIHLMFFDASMTFNLICIASSIISYLFIQVFSICVGREEAALSFADKIKSRLSIIPKLLHSFYTKIR
eukprot:GHVP01053203.1.p1 GENE.GHVP01053203.1~~GHVP01053203.1.p1  ORF type:complete len:446 (-),score=60.62 GHVP01053203.1:1083-2420(-)